MLFDAWCGDRGRLLGLYCESIRSRLVKPTEQSSTKLNCRQIYGYLFTSEEDDIHARATNMMHMQLLQVLT